MEEIDVDSLDLKDTKIKCCWIAKKDHTVDIKTQVNEAEDWELVHIIDSRNAIVWDNTELPPDITDCPSGRLSHIYLGDDPNQ